MKAFDRDSLWGWVGRIADSDAQLKLPEDAAQAGQLRILLSALKGETTGDESAQVLLERLLRRAESIADGSVRHPCVDAIRKNVRYFDDVVRHNMQRAFSDLFLPGQFSEWEREVAKVSLGEFVENLAVILSERGFWCDPEAPLGRAVIVNGYWRTGSTKAYLAICKLLDAIGAPYVTRGLSLTEVDRQLSELEEGAFRGQWVVIKDHLWMPVNRRGAVVICTRRSTADYVASTVAYALNFMKRNGADSEKAMRELEQENSDAVRLHHFHNTYVLPLYAKEMTVLDYDEYYERDVAFVQTIARSMGVAATPAQISQAAAAISVSKIKEIADSIGAPQEETQIQVAHVSDHLGKPGANLRLLPVALVEELKLFGLWPQTAALAAE